MKKSTKITIECGALTCASKPGKFCRFAGSQRYGTKYLCLFPFEEVKSDRDRPRLFDKDGWLQRCGPCLKLFK